MIYQPIQQSEWSECSTIILKFVVLCIMDLQDQLIVIFVPCRRGRRAKMCIRLLVHIPKKMASNDTTDSMANFVTYIFEKHPVSAYIHHIFVY